MRDERLAGSPVLAACPPAGVGRRRGAVLLEALLALIILLVMVGLITSAMHRATSALERMRHRAIAEDLAVTVLSEIEAGIRPRSSQRSATFAEPWSRWTWHVDLRAVADADPIVSERLQEAVVRIEHMDSSVSFELRRKLWRDEGE